uniref:AraC family transcriptional regulator n=1 Tax=Roseihalotalea indica TaxID=2867963 RepID=A0AA49JEP6_9BACT|nr:AraC family transcriptional regulator [Tunicatimonas sp. TK19036]
MADTIAEKIGAKIQYVSSTIIISVPPEVGSGTIKIMRFYHGLSLLCWHLQLNEDLAFYIERIPRHPLRLLFCEQGVLTHSLEDQQVQYQLKGLYAAASACSSGANQLFQLSSKQPVSFCMVEIDWQLYERQTRGPSTMKHSLQQIFPLSKNASSFIYRKHYSQSVSEVLREIEQSEQYQDIVQQTFLESKTLELLSFMIQQYTQDQQAAEDGIALSDVDIERLTQARRYIIQQYVNPPSIKELARRVGLNDFKLKKGYKQLFQATVYEHVRAERLYQAQQLIAQGKWDIGEVVQKVGYTNKSHFSARFEERFGMKPKEYQKRAAQGRLPSPMSPEK